MIPSIGKQKIAYKDHANVKFESMDFYIGLAQKIIAKMAPSFFCGLSKEMLKNEDAISFVATAIMMGDWRWKNGEENTDKKYKNLYSYRNQCGIWAIQTYVTKQYKQKNSNKKIKASYSLNHQEDDMTLEGILPDPSQKEPVNILIDQEDKNSLSNDIVDLLNLSAISDKQKQYIQMYYYENMTLEQIGRYFGVTREAVRQSVKSALEKIRNIVT
jgi:RNA polymerase sigma factor (sigma-70 family)